MKYYRLPLFLLALLLAVPAQAQVTVALPDFTGEPGETVLIPVNLTEALPDAPQARAYELVVTYDAGVVTFTEVVVKDGTLSESLATILANVPEPGRLEVGAAGGTGEIGQGPGVLIYLEAELLAEGTSPLTFEAFAFNEGDPASVTTDGSLSVASGGAPPPPPPSNQAPQVVAPIEDQALRANESIELNIAAVFSDPDGDALTFSAASDAPGIATAELTGSTLTVTGIDVGDVSITVTASDGEGGEVQDVFQASVAGGVDVEDPAGLPEGFSLGSAYPNPFTHTTRLTLTVPGTQHIQAAAYDALGRRVQVLYTGRVTGEKILEMEAGTLASGFYLIKVTGETFETTRQVAVVR